MTNRLGLHCGLHFNRHRCECDYHCTGCKHAYGPHQDDCCTCCRPVGNYHQEPTADPDK